MKIRNLPIFVLFALLVLLWTTPALGKRPVVRIGIVRDGPVIHYPGSLKIIKDEILALTGDEFDVRFPADKTIHGDWTVTGVKRSVDRLLADPRVDLIITLGFGASHYAAQKRILKNRLWPLPWWMPGFRSFPRKKAPAALRISTT